MDTRTSTFRLRIEKVRDALKRHGLAAVLVPSSDPHLSEYLPERWQGRQWLSGFTGSMGTLVVTLDSAAVFADSRYWVQAEAELAGTGTELVKIPAGNSPQHVEWLATHLKPGETVGVDGSVLGLAAAQYLRDVLDRAGIRLRTDFDAIAEVWPERPGLPQAKVYEHRAPQAPLPRSAKLAAVRAAMAGHGATHHFVSTVDDIAWLFNLRGADVSFNPVFLAHALMDASGVRMFVAEGKVDAALQAALANDGVRVEPYAQAGAALAALPASAVLLIDPRRITFGLRANVGNAVKVVEAINPSTLLKSRKTEAEAVHVRDAMAQDGAAMCEFYAWFESALGKERITELTIDEKLSAARAKRPGFVGLSFNTIAAFNANGAMPHYRATPDSHAAIEVEPGEGGLLLIDSGGQYLGGTTDITRVWPIGTITAAHRRDYTLVLKGTLALSRTRFPRGTLSPMLDAIARAPLWEHGLDYGHGTGHGVGYFLNVHEGPQSISRTIPDANMAMEIGMITSIEPGVYRPGRWGVRIENLVMNVPAASLAAQGEFGEFLEFETLTLCPIDTRCIERSLLRQDEIDWLNGYHAEVRARLLPLVDGAAKAWLLERTEPC
jgi:Xaa-Pro aminopeptidase